MLFSSVLIANIAIWISNFIFIISLLPQVLLNFKLKSTKGLSDIFILASLNGQLAYLGYTFFADLPLIYKILNPIYALIILIIIFQRFFYSDGSQRDKKILFFYLSNIALLVIISLGALSGFLLIGSFLGWLPSLIGIWKKLPQIFKVYRSKSVHGFSLLFILFSLIAYVFEICAGITLNLPAPVMTNNIRGFFTNLVFVFQFWLYK